jgi:hypothetical protein
MAKNNTNVFYAVATIVLLLVAGAIAGANLFPVKEVVEKEVTVEVPVEVPAESQEFSYESYLEIAKEQALEFVKDDYDLGYANSEISWDKFRDEWTITFNEDGWELEFTGRVRYDDGYERESHWYQFRVTYDEEDNDYEVEVLKATGTAY